MTVNACWARQIWETVHERPVRSFAGRLEPVEQGTGRQSRWPVGRKQTFRRAIDALEDLLIMADLGVEAAGEIVAALRQRKDLKDLDEELRPRCNGNRRIAGPGPARA